MNVAQAHRGPDDAGIFSDQVGAYALALGHRRLSIQDVSQAGHQPMTHPETGDVIVYNGELYNVTELRTELASSGAQFRSRSDTEVILHAFATWGRGCAERFHGMFAFALWSPRQRTLHMVRDPLGIKPMYVAATPQSLIIASELRAILATGAVERNIDQHGLASLLAYGAVAAPRTMIDGVRLLDPGNWSEVTFGETLVRRDFVYWRSPAVRRRTVSANVAGAELRGPLERAVRAHLISDVPVGVFLSSGIDSTAVAALAAEARGGDIDTFCVCVETDSGVDESGPAAHTAALIGARHHEVRLGEGEALKLARNWLLSTDQPTIDGLNTFVISRAVRERGIVVALSGLGGDEMFGGYSTFTEVPLMRRLAPLARLMPSHLRRRMAMIIANRFGAHRALKVADLAASSGNLIDLCLLRRRLFADQNMTDFGFGDRSLRSRHFLPFEALSSLDLSSDSDWIAIRRLETALYMGNMLLRDSDVFGMAHGLEIRVPLLDQGVVDCALSLSRTSRISPRGPNKPCLVAALGNRLPKHVLSLPKRGFSLPQAEWLVGPLHSEFSDRVEYLARSGLMAPQAVRLAWSRCVHADGAGWSRGWLLATLGAWLEKVRDSRSQSLRLVG